MFGIRSSALALALLAAGLTSIGRAQVKLDWKFPEDSQATYETVQNVHQVLTINGMAVETNAESTLTTRRSIGARRPDGNLPIRQSLEAMKNQISLPGGVTISFDSAKPDAKPDNPQLAFFHDVFKVLLGLNYTIVLDKEQRVAAVEGTEQVQAKANDLNPMAAALLKGELNPDKFKQEFEEELGSLPPILVREGETWDRTTVKQFGGGQAMTFQKRYEYKGTTREGGKELDRIDVQAKAVTFAIDADSNLPAKVTKSELKVDSSEGTILFDRAEGRVVSNREKIRVTGDLTLVINDKDLPSQLDLTLETSSKLQSPAK